MKKTLILFGMTMLLTPSLQASSAAVTVPAESSQAWVAADSSISSMMETQRRWPRWMRRLLNRRGQGHRPGGGRRGR